MRTLDLSHIGTVYIACGYTDMQRGINGLASSRVCITAATSPCESCRSSMALPAESKISPVRKRRYSNSSGWIRVSRQCFCSAVKEDLPRQILSQSD